MEPRGIVKAFPKVKRSRESSDAAEDTKKIKVDVDVRGKCFAGVHAHVLPAGIGQVRSGIFQKQIIQNGGQVYSQLCPEVTHIIVDEGMDCDRAFRLLKMQRLPARVQLVKCSWLSLCIKEKQIVNTAGYSIFIPERYLDVKDKVEPEQRDGDTAIVRKPDDERPQATTSCLPAEVPSDVSKLSDSKDLKVQDILYVKACDDDASDGEDVGVTQGDLEALMFGEQLSKSKDGEKTTEGSKTVAGKWVCAHSSESKRENHNQVITDKLEVLAKAYSVQGDRWRSLGYSKAINALKSYHKPVTSAQDAAKIPGIGKKMAEKIEEILDSGHLRKIDHISDNVAILEVFSNIWGAGVKTAQSWYQQGFRSLDDICTKASLTTQQAIGLKHYEDFLDRMPREEAGQIEETVRKAAKAINPELVCMACGSYRRQKPTCGDVDVLITHADGKSHKGVFSKLIDSLKLQGFLTDDLVSHEDSGNQKKYMGVCRLPGPGWRHRRLDIIIVPYGEFACALLYFTGSAHFNRSMRALAKTKSMSLSEHSLNKDVVRNGSLKVNAGYPLPTPTESHVFEILGLPFREPHERDW
ncbi:DNA polymerase lambda isoform X1 [Bufo gargarizans]|uniref:DNA polymerase lambda isoform X1 n=1 Tax=Bufo gargarizans TaxID=30331 RepID=UPI001CF46752|nr:DNA polymerase lambda isoform X1 [Bufo gargarizans]XP_044125149.1 DNA polymerase lambda isoform X1 [Bufo gargarizans]